MTKDLSPPNAECGPDTRQPNAVCVPFPLTTECLPRTMSVYTGRKEPCEHALPEVPTARGARPDKGTKPRGTRAPLCLVLSSARAVGPLHKLGCRTCRRGRGGLADPCTRAELTF